MSPVGQSQRGVPLHPALVHFPVVFFCLAPLFELLALSGIYIPPIALAKWCGVLGVVSALPVMAVGFYDAFSRTRDEHTQAAIWQHVYWVSAAWSCFCIGLLLTDEGANPVLLGSARVGLQLLGIVLLLVGAHKGARLVHIHRISGPYN